MKLWPLIPMHRRRRRVLERQQIPIAPPPEYYPPRHPRSDTFRSEPDSDSKGKINAPPRGVVIIDM